MKVLLVNGSPHKEGCTYTALCEVSGALNENGIGTDIFWIGNKPLAGCIACKKCWENNKCVFVDSVNEFLDIAGDYDGFVFVLRFIGWCKWSNNPYLWTERFMQISMVAATGSG